MTVHMFSTVGFQRYHTLLLPASPLCPGRYALNVSGNTLAILKTF